MVPFQVTARSSFPWSLCCFRNQVLGSWAWLVPLAVALSTFGTVNGAFFSGSRLCYAAAREGHMVRGGIRGQGRWWGLLGRSWETFHLRLLLPKPRIEPKPGPPQSDVALFSSENGIRAFSSFPIYSWSKNLIKFQDCHGPGLCGVEGVTKSICE